MLIRTNIYLPKQTINFLKQKAEEENVPMAEVIRRFLEREMEEVSKNWVKSLLALARRAKGSGLGDLSKRHDYYLYRPPSS